MTGFRNILTFAAAATALGGAALASPASAQGWHGESYGWRDHGWRDDGWRQRPYDNGYGVDAGETDIAICPQGYHLGRSARLCWPD